MLKKPQNDTYATQFKLPSGRAKKKLLLHASVRSFQSTFKEKSHIVALDTQGSWSIVRIKKRSLGYILT